MRGKQALVSYLANASATWSSTFERPFGYYADGDRVVILGDESFKVDETGAIHRAEWAWVVEVQAGLVTRILHIQDLSGVADLVEDALIKTDDSWRSSV